MLTAVGQWFHEKVVRPLNDLSVAGKLVSVAFGTWFGIFPIPAVSTFLLLFTFNVLRLRKADFNKAQMTLATAVNLLMTPLMFLLLPIWLAIGSFFFRLEECSASDIIPAFSNSVVHAVMQFTGCLTAAAASWVIFTPFALGPFYNLQKRTMHQNSLLPEDREPLNSAS